MTRPSKQQIASIKARAEAEHHATLPPRSRLKSAREDITYCATRDLNLLARTTYRAKVKYYNLQIELLKSELNILRCKLPRDARQSMSEDERIKLDSVIQAKQKESHIYRDWIRHNKEYTREVL